MLKYTVKPNKETELRSFPIRNFYVSPDLSYISGTTDYNTGLVDGEDIVIKSPYITGSEVNKINIETVKVQGYAKVEIYLPVYTIEKTIKLDILCDSGSCYYYENNNKVTVSNDFEDDYVFKTVTQKYVEYKSDISYFFSGSTDDIKGYLVNHAFYKANYNDIVLTITDYIPIEDGKLTVGNYVYDVDFTKESPEIKLNKTKEPVTDGALLGIYGGKDGVLIDGTHYAYGVYYKDIKDCKISEWKKVRKFNVIKNENPILVPEDVMYGGYRHYITYNNENYYLKDVFVDTNYLGYGVLINDKFYPELPGYVDYDIYEAHKDLGGTSNSIYIEETDETLEVFDSLVSFTKGGKFIIFINKQEDSDIKEGDHITATSNGPVKITKVVNEELNDTGETVCYYVTHEGIKYVVENHLFDEVTINGFNYRLTYFDTEYTSASTVVNGKTLYLDVNTGTCKANLTNKVYYKKSVDENDNVLIDYGINSDAYEVIINSGVTINGETYKVIEDVMVLDDDTEYMVYSIEMYDTIKQTFLITEINGASSYICYPVVDEDLVTDYDEDQLQREICSSVVENWKFFTFNFRKDTFGNVEFKPENGLAESMRATKPYTLSNSFLLENKIEIYRIQNYMSFKFPMVTRNANNINREDVIKHNFVDDIKRSSINKIVDMEKDIYFPVYYEIDEDNDNKKIFHPINKLRFNLHFRTRNLDNWKIIEDDRDFSEQNTSNYEMSNWFITDYRYYKENYNNFKNKRLHNSSDLLGFLNFTTDEIKNQATKISKSFLRLSFYSTMDKNTQVLLATSTVFFDGTRTFKKYSDSHRNSDLIYKNVKYYQEGDNIQSTGQSISNFSEVVDDMYLNDGLRFSSRFTVEDKYNTETSSDGYYLYMFKEYAQKLHETTIYLKVEFNHAGIGKTINFMLPRNNNGSPLYVNNSGDLEILKQGFSSKDIYKQTYIPINIVYDTESNRYVYYLPDYLRENYELGIDNDIMEFNLFEVKFKNESIVENKS